MDFDKVAYYCQQPFCELSDLRMADFIEKIIFDLLLFTQTIKNLSF